MAPPAFGKTITQPATGAHSSTVFILHGLGDSGEGLSHIGPALNLPHVKFIYVSFLLPAMAGRALFCVAMSNFVRLISPNAARSALIPKKYLCSPQRPPAK